jgi:hypothetical protein
MPAAAAASPSTYRGVSNSNIGSNGLSGLEAVFMTAKLHMYPRGVKWSSSLLRKEFRTASFDAVVGTGISVWLRWALAVMKTPIAKSHAYGKNLRLRMSSASGSFRLPQNTGGLQLVRAYPRADFPDLRGSRVSARRLSRPSTRHRPQLAATATK